MSKKKKFTRVIKTLNQSLVDHPNQRIRGFRPPNKTLRFSNGKISWIRSLWQSSMREISQNKHAVCNENNLKKIDRKSQDEESTQKRNQYYEEN